MPAEEDTLKPVSLPSLLDFDWRIDVVSASDQVNRMSLPTCLLQFKVADYGNCKKSTEEVKPRNVTVELSKETLDTMLDGLGKIRDQLNSVVSK
ncbi:COMM domain-containing protein 9-like [Hydractinia symbiolongicarpus]|uniref:COMM domain-containing protein 9-like n=1 Tax=Hydractinia symbiolongicarpus TaxID=13093 RepID=UPI00254B60C7|nr:COMM domain-containing protein 9-like [Hydractinia symbiolongicarpus]